VTNGSERASVADPCRATGPGRPRRSPAIEVSRFKNAIQNGDKLQMTELGPQVAGWVDWVYKQPMVLIGLGLILGTTNVADSSSLAEWSSIRQAVSKKAWADEGSIMAATSRRLRLRGHGSGLRLSISGNWTSDPMGGVTDCCRALMALEKALGESIRHARNAGRFVGRSGPDAWSGRVGCQL
jgi:hypothetical protein